MQCLKKIYDYDRGYSFQIAGSFQDPEIEIYFKHMMKEMDIPVAFYGWLCNIPEWLKDKDYLVSSSISEGFSYGIVEGIGSGLLPLIHNWLGSDRIYPRECLYLTSNDCLDILKHYEQIDKQTKRCACAPLWKRAAHWINSLKKSMHY